MKRLNIKRVKSARKLYSNIERDSVSKKNPKVNKANVIKVKKEVTPVVAVKTPEIKEIKSFDEAEENHLKKSKSCSSLIARADIENDSKISDSSILNAKNANNLNRYIAYLKQMLIERSKLNKIEIPPLCQCNNDFLEDMYDWNKCANNCIFYNNPKGTVYYEKNLLFS